MWVHFACRLPCPLATVIGGRLLVDNAIPPELLEQDQTFRQAVFDRFQDERLGQLGNEFPANLARRMLELLAALNPLRAENNRDLIDGIASSTQSTTVEVLRLIGELQRIGLLVRHGGFLRLSAGYSLMAIPQPKRLVLGLSTTWHEIILPWPQNWPCLLRLVTQHPLLKNSQG